MAATGKDTEPDSQLLNHEQDRHEDELQQQQPVTPLHAALASRDDAADIGVGEHDDEAWTQDGDEACQADR